MFLRTLQKRFYHILEQTSRPEPLRKPFEEALIILIAINVLVIVLESIPSLFEQYENFFVYFELVVVLIFTVEYILRAWACTVNEKYKHRIKGRTKYLLSSFALIDLFAILPFYLAFFFPGTIVLIRLSQILRLFRVFKIGRYFRHWEVFVYVFKDKKSELQITFYAIGILLIMSSSIIFYIENPLQPEAFSSIPASMWWGIITMTTVGYGDVVPITTIGKIFGSFIALMGIGLFALPAGILGSGFVDQVFRANKPMICPHCKEDISPSLKRRRSWHKSFLRKLFRL